MYIDNVEFIGYLISSKDIKVVPNKVKIIK